MNRLSRVVLAGVAAAVVWSAIALPWRMEIGAPLYAFGASVAALVVLAAARRALGLEKSDTRDVAMLAWTMLVCSGAFVALMLWQIGDAEGWGPASALNAIRATRDQVQGVAALLDAYSVMFVLLGAVVIAGGLLLASGHTYGFDMLVGLHRRLADGGKRFAAIALCLGSFSIATGTAGVWDARALDVRLAQIEGQRAEEAAQAARDLYAVALDDVAQALITPPGSGATLDDGLAKIVVENNTVNELAAKLDIHDGDPRLRASSDANAFDLVFSRAADVTREPAAFDAIALDGMSREALSTLRESAAAELKTRLENAPRMRTLTRLALEFALAGVDLPLEFEAPELSPFARKIASEAVKGPVEEALKEQLLNGADALVRACGGASCRDQVNTFAAGVSGSEATQQAQRALASETDSLAGKISAQVSALDNAQAEFAEQVRQRETPTAPVAVAADRAQPFDPPPDVAEPTPPPADPPQETPAPDDEIGECTCRDVKTGVVVWTRTMPASQCRPGMRC